MHLRFAIWAAAVGALVGPAVAQDDTARLQVIHNAPDSAVASIDIYVGDDRVVDDLSFREGTAFFDIVAEGVVDFAVTAADADDASSPLFTVAYELEPGLAYQLVATGILGDDFTLLAPGATESPSTDPDRVAVRVVQGAPDLPRSDVHANGEALFDRLVYQDVSPYLEVAPAAVTVDISTTDAAVPVGSYVIDLSGTGGEAVTILASGYLAPDEGQPALALLVVSADGSEALVQPVVTPAAIGPESSTLALSVPNPLRGAMAVQYETAAGGPVRLEVFDARGRRVAVLVEGSVPAGPQTATLDTSALSAGTYVVRLTGGAASRTRTVTVVR